MPNFGPKSGKMPDLSKMSYFSKLIPKSIWYFKGTQENCKISLKHVTADPQGQSFGSRLG